MHAVCCDRESRIVIEPRLIWHWLLNSLFTEFRLKSRVGFGAIFSLAQLTLALAEYLMVCAVHYNGICVLFGPFYGGVCCEQACDVTRLGPSRGQS